MVKDYYRDLCKLLSEHDWKYLRNAKGSHEIWYDPITGKQVTVCHTKSRHTVNKILKSANIAKRFKL